MTIPVVRDVLFVCTGNSCRSQMAEAFLRHLAGGEFRAWSAGTHPTAVDPRAIRAMRELGIEISEQKSKGFSELSERDYACVITVCDNARESCPVVAGAGTRLHWSFRDPALTTGTEEQQMAVFRRVRDQIHERVRTFILDVEKGQSL